MRWVICAIKILVVFALLLSVFSEKAYAYLDSGTGSYVFQLFMAAFAVVLFGRKLFWNKIKIFFKNLFSVRKKNEKTGD